MDWGCPYIIIVTNLTQGDYVYDWRHLDENWRRLSRPSRIMKRATARLPRMKWGLRFTLRSVFYYHHRRLVRFFRNLTITNSIVFNITNTFILSCTTIIKAVPIDYDQMWMLHFRYLEVTRGERTMPRVIAAWKKTSMLEVERSTWQSCQNLWHARKLPQGRQGGSSRSRRWHPSQLRCVCRRSVTELSLAEGKTWVGKMRVSAMFQKILKYWLN